MGLSEVLRLLDGTHSVEDAVRAYEAAKADLEDDRRRQFASLGVPADETCPASRLYHEQSAITRDWSPRLTSDESYAHALSLDYKAYPDSPRVALPPPVLESAAPLADLVAARRSVPDVADLPVTLDAVSTLLGTSAGVTRPGDLPLRAAPSAGALFPVETYLLAFRVDGLESGIYHYAPLRHDLEWVTDLPDRSEVLARILAPGLAAATPPVIVVLTAVFERVQAKYGERGYRFALVETGHVGQNLSLVAGALGLAGNCIGGFCDQEANELLGLDGAREAVVYMFLTGRPRQAAVAHR